MDLIPKRLRGSTSPFHYEKLRQGSLREKTKIKYYDKLYKALKRKAKTFEKSEFKDLEYQKAMIEQLKPRSQLEDDEMDAQLATMYKMYDEQTIDVKHLKEARREFYDEYEGDLSRAFYDDYEKKKINSDAYNRFTNFVQLAHHSHIEELYSSEIITDFMNQYGIEDLRDFADSDELYTEFFDYAEQEELRLKTEAHW